MPFPKDVRAEALVAAARHCCVCHRYKGLNVEVHHIVPEAQGGSNRVENASALCFDCHASAGHYNPKHPKGTRFSPDELREARDRWHQIVERHQIEPPPPNQALYARYLVCRSASVAAEVLSGHFDRAPLKAPLLSASPVRDFQERVVALCGRADRREQVWGDEFKNDTEYARAHPGVEVGRSVPFYYPYFRARRELSQEELLARVVPEDAVTGLLLESGAAAADASVALAYDEICGGGYFQEIYKLRPVWFTFLELRNVCNEPLQLDGLGGFMDGRMQAHYRRFAKHADAKEAVVDLPAPPLLPGESVVVPIATLLGPLHKLLPEALHASREDLDLGHVQAVARHDLSTLAGDVALIGPALWPTTVYGYGRAKGYPLHELDLSNLYTIDRFWEMGCCPHLFFVDVHGRRSYAGELFARAPRMVQSETFTVPPDTAFIEIAELELEETVLLCVSVDDVTRLIDCSLAQNEVARMAVSDGQHVTVEGFYVPFGSGQRPARLAPLEKNRLVRQFLNGDSVQRPYHVRSHD